MDSDTIQLFDSQYQESGGCWNKETCLINGKIESYSGPGSLLENTDLLIKNLNEFIKNNNIKSIIDAPCGDFNYMSKIDLENVQYLGLDVSKNAIEMCKKKSNKTNIEFKVFNIITDTLPKSDLILIKDLFLHLSFSHITTVLENVKLSGCKYFATSRYSHGNGTNTDKLSDLTNRGIEITTQPFYFNFPIIFKTYYTSLHLTTKPWIKDEIIIFQMY